MYSDGSGETGTQLAKRCGRGCERVNRDKWCAHEDCAICDEQHVRKTDVEVEVEYESDSYHQSPTSYESFQPLYREGYRRYPVSASAPRNDPISSHQASQYPQRQPYKHADSFLPYHQDPHRQQEPEGFGPQQNNQDRTYHRNYQTEQRGRYMLRGYAEHPGGESCTKKQIP